MLVHMLIDSVSKGGKLLLNLWGRTGAASSSRAPCGTAAPDRGWMRLHDASITGCTPASHPAADGRYTHNGQRLYLHHFAWHSARPPGRAGRAGWHYAQLLSDGSEIKADRAGPQRQGIDHPQCNRQTRHA
jgi:alpha-L-fucosidase